MDGADGLPARSRRAAGAPWTRERIALLKRRWSRGASARRIAEHYTGQITMRDSPLERALARNVITQEQYSAAQKYRHHWYHAGLAGPLGSIDLDRIFAPDLGGYSGMARTESQLFHRQRYREAVQAVGKLGSHVLDWVVCRETPLEQVGYTLGWSSRPQAYAAAAERAKTALDDLCKLWGIGVETRPE